MTADLILQVRCSHSAAVDGDDPVSDNACNYDAVVANGVVIVAR